MVYLSIQNLLVNLLPQITWNAALCILHKERLVILLEQALAHQNPFIHKTLLLVHSNLTELDIKLNKLVAKFLKRSRLDLQLYLAPRESRIASVVEGVYLQNVVVKQLPVVNCVCLHV